MAATWDKSIMKVLCQVGRGTAAASWISGDSALGKPSCYMAFALQAAPGRPTHGGCLTTTCAQAHNARLGIAASGTAAPRACGTTAAPRLAAFFPCTTQLQTYMFNTKT